MIVPVVGLDPSLRNWGVAQGNLDLDTGYLTDIHLTLIQTTIDHTKQFRQNSKDIITAEELVKGVFHLAQQAKIVFVETPVGSQSANAMKGYGVCVGILGTMKAFGISLIEVSPDNVKKCFTGSKTATKREMIDQAVALYPQANFPRRGDRVLNKAEHLADAIAAIHAGVHTPEFKQLLRLLK